MAIVYDALSSHNVYIPCIAKERLDYEYTSSQYGARAAGLLFIGEDFILKWSGDAWEMFESVTTKEEK